MGIPFVLLKDRSRNFLNLLILKYIHGPGVTTFSLSLEALLELTK